MCCVLEIMFMLFYLLERNKKSMNDNSARTRTVRATTVPFHMSSGESPSAVGKRLIFTLYSILNIGDFCCYLSVFCCTNCLH